MANREAWEAFYKTGKISDYMAFLNAGQGLGSLAVAGIKGEDTDHAADFGRPYHPPKAQG